MERVLLLAEGQSEEKFVKLVLQPHLWAHDVDLQCTLVVTSKEEGRRAFRGGVTRYARVRDDIRKLLLSRPRAVTTLFDVYASPKDLPGYPQPWPASSAARSAALSAAVEADISDPRFFAGWCVHEFEGLLYTSPEILAETIEPEVEARKPIADALHAIRNTFATPEDIDDGRESAPSKRLRKVTDGYSKTRHGPVAASRIGLDAIRSACPLFAAWLLRLELLGSTGKMF